jgi:hypothetical protein
MATRDGDLSDRLARRYLAFAENEAKGRSPLYEEISRAIIEDRWTLEFLGRLPPIKQQPNLLLAAVRHICGTVSGWPEFQMLLRSHSVEVAAVMMERSTQTNEPARCATLLPVLAGLPQPIVLLEVGASAGLCLMPDRYGYSYGDHRVAPTSVGRFSPPVFLCCASDNTPLPETMPVIVWRVGLDLNPVDLNDADQVAWLETLVWPEEMDRLAHLRAALAIAKEHRPLVVRGDLRTDLPALAAQAPKDATLVVFHSAVLAYLERPDRLRFRESLRATAATWISNEAPQIVSDIVEEPPLPHPSGSFLLTVDGHPKAWTDPHGRSIQWIGGRG